MVELRSTTSEIRDDFTFLMKHTGINSVLDIEQLIP